MLKTMSEPYLNVARPVSFTGQLIPTTPQKRTPHPSLPILPHLPRLSLTRCGRFTQTVSLPTLPSSSPCPSWRNLSKFLPRAVYFAPAGLPLTGAHVRVNFLAASLPLSARYCILATGPSWLGHRVCWILHNDAISPCSRHAKVHIGKLAVTISIYIYVYVVAPFAHQLALFNCYYILSTSPTNTHSHTRTHTHT